jgi:galactosyl transferase GMA12/MNN10 family
MYSESERVWAKLGALRDAISQYPRSEWFWYLDLVKSPKSPPVLLVECNYYEPFNTITYTLSFPS